MTTIQQIKSHINPLRVLKINEWVDIGVLLKNQKGFSRFIPESNAVYLLSRYESLTSQPLTKEMFVNSEKEPIREEFAASTDQLDLQRFNYAMDDYQAALKQIWFEGFEINTDDALIDTIVILGPVEIHFQKLLTGKSRVCIWAKGELLLKDGTPTLFDFIYHVDFYNRTTSKPVEINVTDSFIQELIK